MLFSVLTATVLPASCLTSRIGLPLATMSAPKSFLPEPCADVPGAIASTGRPFDAAISSDTTFEPATWILPLTSAGTVAAPPCEVCRSILRPCLSKNPFAIPNPTNADGTPAVSCTCRVVGPELEPAVEPPPSDEPLPPPHAAIARAPSAAIGPAPSGRAAPPAARRDRQGAQRRDRRGPHRLPHLGASSCRLPRV